MAYDVLRVWIRLERIHCYDEADSWGRAEPYLWTVFFKVDGSGVWVTDELKLAGQALVETTPGSHGNLGDTDVDAGDDVAIPSAIGEWRTLLRGIPAPPVNDQFPGTVGVVCVLMEQDSVTDPGAEAGHRALNDAVRAALAKVVATRDPLHVEVTPEEIKEFTDGIDDAVKAGVRDQQTFFQNAWSWLNADDQIGSKVFLWTHGDLTAETIDFSQRWKHEGDWEIFGHVIATPDRFLSVLESITPQLEAAVKAAGQQLQEFRDHGFGGTNLQGWWALVERNTPDLAHSLQQDEAAADATGYLVGALPNLLERQDEKLPEQFLERMDYVLGAVQEHGGRQARRDVSLVRDVLPQLRGMTTGQALELLASHPPAKGEGKRSRKSA